MEAENKLIAIDTKSKRIFGAHSEVEYLVKLAEKKCRENDFLIIGCTAKEFSSFSQAEIEKISFNLTGQKVQFKSYSAARKAIATEAFELVEMSDTDVSNVSVRKVKIPPKTEQSEKPKMTEANTAAPTKTGPRKKSESRNGVSRPSPTSKTGRIWEIADSMPNANRKDVLEVAVAEGINASTASTQYGNWRRYNGLTGKG